MAGGLAALRGFCRAGSRQRWVAAWTGGWARASEDGMGWVGWEQAATPRSVTGPPCGPGQPPPLSGPQWGAVKHTPPTRQCPGSGPFSCDHFLRRGARGGGLAPQPGVGGRWVPRQGRRWATAAIRKTLGAREVRQLSLGSGGKPVSSCGFSPRAWPSSKTSSRRLWKLRSWLLASGTQPRPGSGSGPGCRRWERKLAFPAS